MDRRFTLALSMPIALILLVLLVIHWPSFSAAPQQDFLFSIMKNPCAGGNYSVEHQTLTWHALPATKEWMCEKPVPPKLFRYKVATNTIIPLTVKAAKNLKLDASPRSNDGFEVIDSSQDFFLPSLYSFYPRAHVYYLSGHGKSIELQLSMDPHQFELFQFLGWIQS